MESIPTGVPEAIDDPQTLENVGDTHEAPPARGFDPNPTPGTRIAKTTCYMCACRCGIDVHMDGNEVRYIEGNRDHPVNQGVLCAKGSAGIMQVNAPSRLRSPMKRVGPRGSGEFEDISWDEALTIATDWLKPLREQAPEKLAFFTGRDQSQSFTGFWAQQFGTPNYAAHGGFCSVNMAAAGIYSMGGAFWEFGQPDWEKTELFMLFGVAEDHDSNPIKMGLGRLKERGAKVIGVNPVRTGYNAVADEWVGITPGTDGLFIMAMIHVLLRAGRVDLDYLARYTNAAAFVDDETGLLRRDKAGRVVVSDARTGKLAAIDGEGVEPDMRGTLEGAKTSFTLLAERFLADEYAPEAVAERCGISADRIRRIAAQLAHAAFEKTVTIDQPWTDFRGKRHERMTGRPVSFHAMRGISAHSNGFQTCRALHVLQMLLGSIEVPGGFRFKPPYPKPVHAHPKPHAEYEPGAPLPGPHLGFPRSPDDLCVCGEGKPKRIDKAFTWENPLSVHGMMHMVISNAHAGDPYEIDTLFLFMANMAWNSSMNTKSVMEMLTDKRDDGEYVIPRIIYSDAYSSETVAYADLILPDTTYLERHDCISLLDRPICEADAAADAIRWPVVEPERDVQGFQTTLVQLGARLGLPAFTAEDGSAKWADYADYMVNHIRRPATGELGAVGPLAGFRGDGTRHGRGDPNPDQIEAYKRNGGFWVGHIPDEARYMKPWNRAYQDWAVELGIFDAPQPYVFSLYSEELATFVRAADGHGDCQPPDRLRQRIRSSMDPLPVWYEPLEEQAVDHGEYPLHAITQRPAAMYHAWGSQNAWLRQIHGTNPLYIPGKVWREHGFAEGDWARLSSVHGAIEVPVLLNEALNENTVWTWNAIGKRKGAWALDKDAPEATKGFLLNHLIHELLPPRGDGMRWSNSDPVTGQAAWYDLRVKIERIAARAETAPAFLPMKSPVPDGPAKLQVGK